MKLWLISQSVNDDYDTFDSAVVAAKDEEAARNTQIGWVHGEEFTPSSGGSWASPEYVQVKLIGTAVRGTKAGVICSSFNAG